MEKYIIEGNIDFFSELYKSLDIEENEEKTQEDDNLCLITNEALTEYFVKLECGHKFNYIPLFNDIKNHKNKFNYLEGKVSHLKQNEIRCPYCRNKQETTLPYYEELGIPKTHGVNYIDPKKPYKWSDNTSNYKKCEYSTETVYTDSSGNNQATQIKCLQNGYCQISKFIEGYTGEEQYFCFSHRNKKIREHNKMLKDKAVFEAKQAKIKAKEDAKKEKEESKLKAKEDKIIIKKKKKSTVENIVLGPANVISVTSTHAECIEILKSGPNKGKQCGCKVYHDSYCKRHMKYKESNPEDSNQENSQINIK
jgi:hypothetical protein